jgi:hypothetical protein
MYYLNVIEILCDLKTSQLAIRPPPESFVKNCDEVCDTYSIATCNAPNNATLRFPVTLKAFSDTFCIVKCAML